MISPFPFITPLLFSLTPLYASCLHPNKEMNSALGRLPGLAAGGALLVAPRAPRAAGSSRCTPSGLGARRCRALRGSVVLLGALPGAWGAHPAHPSTSPVGLTRQVAAQRQVSRLAHRAALLDLWQCFCGILGSLFSGTHLLPCSCSPAPATPPPRARAVAAVCALPSGTCHGRSGQCRRVTRHPHTSVRKIAKREHEDCEKYI